MSMQPSVVEASIREQLLDRRQKLEAALPAAPEPVSVRRLIQEVDQALDRMVQGSYGLCETCHDPIESDRLLADPLTRFCLDHLTVAQQKALEEDLALASRIQRGLLPEKTLRSGGWEVAYYYESAGIVGGDYCDVVQGGGGDLYLLVGDVSGKGVAASMLMSHLHATFHTLVSMGVPLVQMVLRANRLFCESTLPNHYATLLCAHTGPGGEIKICNAGHLPPILASAGGTKVIRGGGVPLGLFCEAAYQASSVQMAPGQTMMFYTDGLSESRNESGDEYGRERLGSVIGEHRTLAPADLLNACLGNLERFRGAAARSDDLTMMAVRWAP